MITRLIYSLSWNPRPVCLPILHNLKINRERINTVRYDNPTYNVFSSTVRLSMSNKPKQNYQKANKEVEHAARKLNIESETSYIRFSRSQKLAISLSVSCEKLPKHHLYELGEINSD